MLTRAAGCRVRHVRKHAQHYSWYNYTLITWDGPGDFPHAGADSVSGGRPGIIPGKTRVAILYKLTAIKNILKRVTLRSA